MSGDYSRFAFDAAHDYAGVLLQQGRPLTDCDWNELVAEWSRARQVEAFDTFGGVSVVPITTPDGFRIGFDANGNLTIGRGRIYVDGLLAENHGAPPLLWDPQLAELHGSDAIRYDEQPYFPNGPALPEAGGPFLVYVDAWKREITAIEAPDLVEKALGVDTTARVQIVWQVKVLPNPDGAEITCGSDAPGWAEATAPSAARLTTGTATFGTPDPCLIPPSGGY